VSTKLLFICLAPILRYLRCHFAEVKFIVCAAAEPHSSGDRSRTLNLWSSISFLRRRQEILLGILQEES
jgi:hypothetical protein